MHIQVHGEACRLQLLPSLSAAEAVWRDFDRSAERASSFQLFDWLAAWQEHVGAPGKLRPQLVVVEGENGVPWMLLPLGIRRRGLSRVLVWLGGGISGYHGPCIAKACPDLLLGAGFMDLWAACCDLLPRFDLLHFDRQPPRVGERPNPFLQLGPSYTSFSSPVATVGDNWKRYYQGKYSGKSRGKFRRKVQRMGEEGELRFEVAETPAQADEIIQVLCEQKSRWFREQGVNDLFAVPGNRAFLHALARDQPDLVHVSCLRVGGRIRAAHWGLMHGGTLYYWFQSHAEDELTRYSPAEVLLRMLMRWCADNGVPRFDFGIGDHPYKLRWSDELVPLHDVLLPQTLQGRAHMAMVVGERRLRERIKASERLYPIALDLRARLFGGAASDAEPESSDHSST